MKANPAPEILKLLAKAGSSFDTASINEIDMVLATGASAEALALLSPLEGGMASAEGMAFAPMIVEVRPSRACCVQAARMLLHACARRCL